MGQRLFPFRTIHSDEIRVWYLFRAFFFTYFNKLLLTASMASLKPTGFPLDNTLNCSTNCNNPSASLKAEWPGGESTSVWGWTPLFQQFPDYFGCGKYPPWPGFAPCESLISIIFTCSQLAFCLNFPHRNSHFRCDNQITLCRFPTKSPPCKWYSISALAGIMKKSPALAPKFKAWLHFAQAPKLMAEILNRLAIVRLLAIFTTNDNPWRGPFFRRIDAVLHPFIIIIIYIELSAKGAFDFAFACSCRCNCDDSC